MFIDNVRFGINTTKSLNPDRNTLFYSDGSSLKLNRSGVEDFSKPNLNSYMTLESFLKDFEISFEDIV